MIQANRNSLVKEDGFYQEQIIIATLTDVAGMKVGHYSDLEDETGVTVAPAPGDYCMALARSARTSFT